MFANEIESICNFLFAEHQDLKTSKTLFLQKLQLIKIIYNLIQLDFYVLLNS